MSEQHYLIALGGNSPSDAGAPRATLHAALTRLPGMGARVLAASRMYRTPCFPAGAGPDYVNAAARLAFDGNPAELLQLLHELENRFGRARVQRWGQRTLDLDLLAAGDRILPDRETFDAWQGLPLERQMRDAPDRLILPHPRLHERGFVLVPLNDVASDWVHPVSNLTVAAMLAALPEDQVAEVVPLD
ncbi:MULTISPECIES: 2-amino-4-hydroxy-6-hydroxymethyldihydropteridine diphosphokinase [unclassified Roseovarius]|uniref:2-amino-4-hydroxy-6- hydroxymethyldihydropteridine diphosphokinase n=1 Tax=unclassified Roseovarius TaxID=2614913 RepID=UPI00273E446C|nr:2-amino-4-hydroxy-6-hydroxymethyldihydropteridine diphosphokinase [Roseovarius sp. MMSF_3350]